MPSIHALNVVELRKDAKQFDSDSRSLRVGDAITAYIEGQDGGRPLFPDELRWLRQVHKNTPETDPKRRPDLMVFTVGTSFQPILLSLALTQPRHAVFLLAPRYVLPEPNGSIDGARYGETFADAAVKIDRSFGKGDLKVSSCVLKGDSPAEVFGGARAEITKLLSGAGRAVIDITGAKKSMSTGAFLFAAYSGMDIQYMDFTLYDDKSGRPYTDCCRLRTLSDPADVFQLGLWDRARAQYEAGNFDSALESLTGWLAVIDSAEVKVSHEGEFTDPSAKPEDPPPLFDPRDRAALTRLRGVVAAYQKWQSGDFRGAAAGLYALGWENLTANIPEEKRQQPAVMQPRFCEKWIEYAPEMTFEQLRTKADNLKSLTNDLNAVRVYAYDELTKLRRLIENARDYRSVFLRAQGLNELLLTTRLKRAITDDQITVEPYAARKAALGSLWHAEDTAILLFTGEWMHGKETTVKLSNDSSARMSDMVLGVASSHDHFDELRQLRNHATHHFMSIPRSAAEAALTAAEANLADMEAKYGDPSVPRPHTTAVPWDDLVKACGFSFPSRPAIRSAASSQPSLTMESVDELHPDTSGRGGGPDSGSPLQVVAPA